MSFLYRDDYYERDDDDNDDGGNGGDNNDGEQDVGEVEVIIEKNRSGPRGTVKLLFVKSYNKFSSIAYGGGTKSVRCGSRRLESEDKGEEMETPGFGVCISFIYSSLSTVARFSCVEVTNNPELGFVSRCPCAKVSCLVVARLGYVEK